MSPKYKVGDTVISTKFFGVGVPGTIVAIDTNKISCYFVNFDNGETHWKEGKYLEIMKLDRCTKDTNPKDAVGIKKVPISTVPFNVLGEIGLALMEGARKYGRHNYRVVGVRASVYLDAQVLRHIGAWWEGEDIDPDSGMNHITKAIAGLIVLRDAMVRGNWEDDRPPKSAEGWVQELNKKAAEIIEKYPDCKKPYTEKNKCEK